jgi:hypothetical protein
MFCILRSYATFVETISRDARNGVLMNCVLDRSTQLGRFVTNLGLQHVKLSLAVKFAS